MFFRDKARPFKELNEDAAEFIGLFKEDINMCSEILDHMLSDLFLESRRDHASDQEFLVTFSKKKFEIYKSTSSLLNELEEKWVKQISELKKKFVENTEIYLAGFKATTEVPSDIIDPLKRANMGNRKRDNRPLKATDGGKIISLIDNSAMRLEELSAGMRTVTGINRETTPPIVTVDMSVVSSTEVLRNDHRRVTPSKVVDQSEMFSTPPNASKVRSRKGTPNRVAVDRIVADSKRGKMNVDSYSQASTSTGKAPKKVHFAINDDDLDSNFSEDSLAEFDARQKSMHNYLEELKKHKKDSPEGKDYREIISWTLPNSEDSSEEVMPRSRDHQKTIANTFEENLDLNPPEKVMPRGRGRRKTISSTFEENLEDLNPPEKVMPKGRGRRKTISSSLEENLEGLNPPEKVMPKARGRQKTISRTLEENLEDLNPEEEVAPKPSGRRKTISSAFEGNLEDVNTTLDTVSQTSLKRKSISSLNAAASPKRLRSGKRNSVASATKVKEEPANNPLESDSSALRENYTQWVLLQDLGSKISTKPGVYELKVWRAKKSAFIGSCENLFQKFELYRLGQNSGHKHLDKFLERNKNDVLMRYEEMPSFAEAKVEQKRRIESFVALHKTTPAYN